MGTYYKYNGNKLETTDFATKQEALSKGYALDQYGAEYGMPLGNIFANGNEWRYNVSSVNQGVPIVSNANPQVSGELIFGGSGYPADAWYKGGAATSGGALGIQAQEAAKVGKTLEQYMIEKGYHQKASSLEDAIAKYGADNLYGRQVGNEITYHVLAGAKQLPKLQPEAGKEAEFKAAGGAETTSAYQYGADVLNKKANNAAVNTLYNSYFGRNASQPELDNWGAKGGADTTVKALEDFLKAEKIKYNDTTPIKPIGQVKQDYTNLSSVSGDGIGEILGGVGTGDLPLVTDKVKALETQVGSLTSQLETLKNEQLEAFNTSKAEAQARIDASYAKIKELQDSQKAELEKADPTKQAFYAQETRILQNQLDAAELASSKLEEDYNKFRELTDELNALNVEANAEIQAVKGTTGLSALINPRINKTIDDWTGRSSVLQAAMAGVNNNINLSYQYIDKAQVDLTARKNEEINYYNAMIGFYEGLEVSENKKLDLAVADKADAAQNIIDMKNTEIANLEAVSNTIKQLMLDDPIRAAGAGLNLATDSLETITLKLANYDYGQEVIGIKNTMEENGYKYVSTPAERDRLKAEGYDIIERTDSRGISRTYANPNISADDGSWTVVKDAKGNVVSKINSKTGEIINLDGSTGTNTIATGSDLATVGNIGGQCGDYLHKIADNIPTMGDLFTDKMKMGNLSTNKYQVGDVLIQETNMPYGHVSIVTEVNGDQATVVESNYGLDEKIGTRTITMGDASVKGVYRGAQFKDLPAPTEEGRSRKDMLLAQIKNGLLTKGDATDIINEYSDDKEFSTELTKAFNDPKNGSLTVTQAEKYNVPTLITKGQFDIIVDEREKNGFGNKLFQGVGTKEYDNVVNWLEMEKDLTSIRALKEGGKYIKTLPESEQQRIFEDYKTQFGVDTLEELLKTGEQNTGPITAKTLPAREFFGAGDARLIEADIISGKYTVDFMKQISGVAISENEAKRLQTLVPNIVLEDARFKSAAKDAQDGLYTQLSSASNKFGFDSIDELRTATERTRNGEYFDIDEKVLSGIEDSVNEIISGSSNAEDLRTKYNY